MTPKEKADELIQQMFSFCPIQEPVKLMVLQAKYCAIQTAKEIIFEHKQFMHQEEARIKFWEEVESELRLHEV